jgi:hypothetical protein
LAGETFPLSFAYRLVAVDLLLACDWQSPAHIYPYDAHFKILLVAANQILWKSSHPDVIDAMALVRRHLIECWGL